MVLDMESDDSRGSSPSNSSESRSNSPANDKDAASHDAAADSRPPVAVARSVRSVSTSSSSSNSSSSSSRSAISAKNMKKSSSSSSGSGSGSSTSSGSSSEDEPDQESSQQPQQKPQHQEQPEPEAAISEDNPVPSPSAKSQPSSFLSSVRSRSNSPGDQQLYNQAAVDLNISHEDLSDVSDIEAETEKRVSSKNPTPHPVDEDEDGAISNDSLPRHGEKEAKLNGKAAVSGGLEKVTTASAKESKVSEMLTKQAWFCMTSVLFQPEDGPSNGRAGGGLDEDLVKTHDDDALDFEAEEGECAEPVPKEASDQTKDETKANESNQAKGTPKSAKDDEEDDGEVDAEEGEEKSKDGQSVSAGNGSLEEGEDTSKEKENDLAKKKKDEEELEEGEVSDEDEKRPEETEPKPVCRFYTRGQCTWGMSCRFLHPGVTDKGNYTMFESLVRSVPMQGGAASGTSAGGSSTSAAAAAAAVRSAASAYSAAHAAAVADYHDYRNERPALHHRSAMHHPSSVYASHGHDPRSGMLPEQPTAGMENAWERGLRTAKEMMRKANKRKEQDMDFEDKKMNLTLSPDELEKDPFYLKERGGASSPPPPSRGVEPPMNPHSMAMSMHPHASLGHSNPRALLPLQYSVYGPMPDRYGRSQYMHPPYEDVDAYGRMARYRELPPHRMPHYEDDRRLRPAREVIVQRVEAAGRGDEWSDPWMRSKSMGRGSYERDDRRRRERRSYSTNSSYSTSNSSQSDSSDSTSRSSSPSEHKRRYGGSSHKAAGASGTSSRRHSGHRRSSSQAARRRHTSKGSPSPSFKRAAMEHKRHSGGHSPASKRKKLSSPSQKKLDKLRRRHSSSSSDSDSSDTSYSESESGSSSSDSSSGSQTPQKRVRSTDKALNERKLIKKPPEVPRKRSPISIEIKKTSNMVGVSALASPNSIDSEKEKDHHGKDSHSKEKEHNNISSGSKDKDKDKEREREKDNKEHDKDNKDKDNKDGKKSRREELLKQLRAVEDAIAKKRSKLT
ncbi:hypothetical protein KR074_002423 [Drosophila pseudoananassae]|nr:hypothetical protein KR074_002423 [Drosophila pseudoananassae]